MELVDRVAEAVLYEGYLLYPYRRSAMKNQQRWQFGGIYPKRYSTLTGGGDPWTMQTQCLLRGDDTATVEIRLRFLQVVDRRVVETTGDGIFHPVESLRVGEQVYRGSEEAIERTTALAWSGGQATPLRELVAYGQSQTFEIAAGNAEELLRDPGGTVRGALVREWRGVRGTLDVRAEPLPDPVDDHLGGTHLYQLTVTIHNTTAWTGHRNDPHSRKGAMRQAFISTHTILRVRNGDFISLLEPAPIYADAAESCRNIGTWPVLVGEPGERHTILSSPIILYDYPQIAPESPVSYFDATEIDELLALSVLTLSDDEKREMSETDPRAREILERTEALTHEELAGLHGAVRGWQVRRREER